MFSTYRKRSNVPPQVLDLGVFPKGTQEPNYQFLGQLAKFSQGLMMLVSGREESGNFLPPKCGVQYKCARK